MIGDLGRQMLRRGADALTRWATHPVLRTADVSVNISALHIVREDLVSDVSELVACHGLAAQRLVVELTESHRLTEVDSVASAFTKLCSLGVRLAIDDFGTGYSSFGQLLELPVSIVKIDRSLIAGCDHDNRRAGVVRAIQQLSKSLGHVVVSEGVETPAEHRAVIDLGIDQAQGYLFCPPLPLETLEQELASAGARRITR